MLILIVTERLYRHPARGGDLSRREPGSAPTTVPTVPPPPSPLDPLLAGTPQGTRYQLLRALRAMAGGQAMVVERRIPSLAEHFDDDGKRESWFRSLRSAASWLDQRGIEPIVVPGTAFPGLIGHILLRTGWCAPSETPHWVPNLRFFYLTDIGHDAFRAVQAWWLGLSPLQRIRLIFVE